MDQGARGEVLARAGPLVGGALTQQLLVGVALDVGAGATPVLAVDEVDDEALEFGGVLDPVLGLAEDRADDPRLARQSDEDAGVFELERVALCIQQPLPRVLRRDDLLGAELPGGALVRHLEEEQVGQLLGVLDDADPVVAQDVAVRPELVDQSARVSHATIIIGQHQRVWASLRPRLMGVWLSHPAGLPDPEGPFCRHPLDPAMLSHLQRLSTLPLIRLPPDHLRVPSAVRASADAGSPR